KAVCALFTRMGWDVEATPYVRDGGIDGYLRKDGQLILLQCKRVKGYVGEPVVRDLWGTIDHAKAIGGIVVTTGTVSSSARHWIRGKAIHVVELDELCSLMRKFFAAEG